MPAHASPDVSARLPDAVLRPVREGNAFESTVEHLATAIHLGVFAAGERLPPERELAERLGVSRATLREAIGALRQASLVRTTRGRGGGTVVVYRGHVFPSAGFPGTVFPGTVLPGAVLPETTAGPPPDLTGELSAVRIIDALAFRRVVEPGAAYLAATADLSADQRAWLVTALEAATARGDDGARRVADARLHLAIASVCGSSMIVDAVAQAQRLLGRFLTAIPVLRANIAHSDAQHAQVVHAVLAGDAGRARSLMEEHCDATSALLRGLLVQPQSLTPSPMPREHTKEPS